MCHNARLHVGSSRESMEFMSVDGGVVRQERHRVVAWSCSPPLDMESAAIRSAGRSTGSIPCGAVGFGFGRQTRLCWWGYWTFLRPPPTPRRSGFNHRMHDESSDHRLHIFPVRASFQSLYSLGGLMSITPYPRLVKFNSNFAELLRPGSSLSRARATVRTSPWSSRCHTSRNSPPVIGARVT